MAWSRYSLFVAVLMVVTGSLNTLTTNWADTIYSQSSDGTVRRFTHPFVQSLVMFFGEFMCLIAFKILYYVHLKRNDGSVDTHTLVKGNRNFSVFIFYIPAFCDMFATSIMYVGLTLTYPSSFQMLRGALIPFTALLSAAFLGRHINSRQWTGVFFIVLGLLIVGLADFVSTSGGKSINNVITGDLLIVLAQMISAVQMVTEESYVSGQNVPPLQAVGWEGIFGFSTLFVLLFPMYFIKVGHPFSDNPRGVIEDALDALVQVSNNYLLLVPLIGTIFSIAFFNFAGISMTKIQSAASRTVLDSIRVVVVWVVSIYLKWQVFSGIQVFGFGVLIIGFILYFDIGVTPLVRRISDTCRRSQSQDAEILIDQAADEAEALS